MILRPITSPLKPSFRVVDGVACLVHRGAIWQVAHIIHKDGPGQRRSLVKTAWTFATNIWVNPGVLPMIKLAWTIGVKNPTRTQTNKQRNKPKQRLDMFQPPKNKNPDFLPIHAPVGVHQVHPTKSGWALMDNNGTL